MTPSMYFVPIIERALMQPDPEAALIDAFTKIERIGQQPLFRSGHEQFVHFMAISVSRVAMHIRSLIRLTMRECISDLMFDQCFEYRCTPESFLDFYGKLFSGWRPEFERCKEDYDELVGQSHPAEVMILSNKQVIDSFRLKSVPANHFISDVVPGRYGVQLRTGRVLWEGEISANDVRWTLAFPNRPFVLAAATGPTVSTPSREIVVLGGELVVRVYPGLDTGRLELDVMANGGSAP